MSNTIVTQLLDRKCFGKILMTPSVLDVVPHWLILRLVDRHFINDWGELPEEDAEINSDCINACHEKTTSEYSNRIMSIYKCPNLPEHIWIMTYLQHDSKLQQDPDCCNTVVMFPSEY
jgi:hypothetical protein